MYSCQGLAIEITEMPSPLGTLSVLPYLSSCQHYDKFSAPSFTMEDNSYSFQ